MSRTRVGGLTRAERLDWLRLIRTEQVGPITFFDLLDRYGNAAAALEAIPELAKRGGRSRPLTPPSRSAAEAELRRITAAGARLVALGEPFILREPAPLNTFKYSRLLLGRDNCCVCFTEATLGDI